MPYLRCAVIPQWMDERWWQWWQWAVSNSEYCTVQYMYEGSHVQGSDNHEWLPLAANDGLESYARPHARPYARPHANVNQAALELLGVSRSIIPALSTLIGHPYSQVQYCAAITPYICPCFRSLLYTEGPAYLRLT